MRAENLDTKILDEISVLNLLKELDQVDILHEYHNERRTNEERKNFIEQINSLEQIYPGGLTEYVKRAKILLNNSKNNRKTSWKLI